MDRSGSGSPSAGRLLERLPPPFDRRLAAVRAAAGALGLPVWWVGGGVRDRLLGLPTLDLDLVVEGRGGATRLATELASRLGGRVTGHERFLTATVELDDGGAVDVATARAEIYERPASLPVVAPAPLATDLRRRDFTLNAIALRVAPAPAELCDPCDGVADLGRGSLRVLHPASFRDDPTRILRGLRFEARFGFAFAAETERLARAALAEGVLGELTSERLRAAWQLLWERMDAIPGVLARCADLGLLEALEPGLAETPPRLGLAEAVAATASGLGLAEAGLAPPRPPFLALLLAGWPAPRAARHRLAGRIALGSAERDRIVEGPERVERLSARLESGAGPAPHEVERSLRELGSEELLALSSCGDFSRRWVERYLAELRPLRLGIRGADLLAAGVSPGPEIGQALEATRAARLDRRLGAEEELEFAVAFARRERGRRG